MAMAAVLLTASRRRINFIVIAHVLYNDTLGSVDSHSAAPGDQLLGQVHRQ